MLFYFHCLIHFSVRVSVLHFQSVSTEGRTPVAQARRLWQEHRWVRQPPLLSSSLTGRLLGNHCWRLTAVCSLAPLSVLLSPRYPQVLRACAAHLSIRGRRSHFPGRWSRRRTGRLRVMVEDKPVDDIEGVCGFAGRCPVTSLAFTFSMAHSSSTDHCSCLNNGGTPGNGLHFLITQHDKSSVKNKTAGCFLQRCNSIRCRGHIVDDGPRASPCLSKSQQLLTVPVGSRQYTGWHEELDIEKPSLGSFTCWKALLYTSSVSATFKCGKI